MPRGKRTKQPTESSDSGPTKRSRAGGDALTRDDIPSIVKAVIDALQTTVRPAETSTTTTNRQLNVTATTNDSGPSSNTRHQTPQRSANDSNNESGPSSRTRCQATQRSSNEREVNPTTNRGGTAQPSHSEADSDSHGRENTGDEDIGEYVPRLILAT